MKNDKNTYQKVINFPTLTNFEYYSIYDSVICKLVSPCDHKYSYENAHRYAVMGKKIEKERDTERERDIERVKGTEIEIE